MEGAPMKTRLILLLLIALSMGSSAEINAQATATINGTVKDANGALIPSVIVTLVNDETSLKKTVETNDSGLYVLPYVAPGKYTISASKTGFRTSQTPNLTVEVNQGRTLDFILEVGEVTQSVVVEDSMATLQTSNASLGTVIKQQQVNELPLNGRNFTQLLALTPGVSPVSVAQNAGGAQAAPVGQFVFPSVNGQSNRSNYFMLDGINDTDTVFTTYAVAPILDDILEFKVMSHNDEAQFGGVLGGIVNVVTKAGTNNFRGTGWEFVRNDAFDARSPFASVVTPLKQHQYGVNFGGPVVFPRFGEGGPSLYNLRNHTFFFFSYEKYRRDAAAVSTFYRVPTAAELSGDFSNSSVQIFNPFSTRPDPNNPGRFIRDPFPGNRIPAGLINQSAVNIARAVFPAPLNLGRSDLLNGQDVRASPVRRNQYSFRIDQNLGSSSSAFFRWSDSKLTRTGSGGRVGLDSTTETFGKQYVAGFSHTFSPTSTLNVTFGHVDLTNIVKSFFGTISGDALVSLSGVSPGFACGFEASTGSDCIVPAYDIDGFSGGGEGISSTKLTDLYQIRTDFTKIHGKHTFTSGFNFERNSFGVLNNSAQETFGAFQTSDPNQSGTGNSLASFLLGVPSAAFRRLTDAPVDGFKNLGFYFMDQWKVSDRLTLNLGARYDVAFWPKYGTESNNTDAIGNIDFNNGTYILQRAVGSCAQLGAAPCIPGSLDHIVVSESGRLFNNTYDNLQPRIGLAYRLNERTVLRGSFGTFYELHAGVVQTVQGIGGGWPSIAQLQLGNLNPPSAIPTTTIANPLATLGQAAFPAPSPFDQVQWYRDPKAKDAYSAQWTFGVQRQLGPKTGVTANYVGSHNGRLTVGGFFNVATTPGPGNPRDRSPYPYIAPTFYDRSVGKSDYHSFQFALNGELRSSLTYLVSYTLSNSKDIGCSGYFGIEGCSIQDPYHLENDRSVSGFDLPHVLSTSFTAPLPFGRGKRFDAKNGFANALIGNWQLNGIVTMTSGLPYDVGISGDIANTGMAGCCAYGYERLNLVGDPNLSNPTPGEWFNRAAFAVPDPFTFGNLGRHALRGDWFKNFDLSLIRRIPLGEDRRVELRAEAFNVTNTPTFALPVRDFSNANFGRVFGTRSTERQLQFAVKLYF